jgi:hypothetical protein
MSCLSTRLFSSPRRKPQQEKQHGPHHNSAISRPQTSRAADTFHTANVLPLHPIVFPSPPQTATGKATRSASQQCNQPPTNSRAADTFHTANVLPLHPIVFLRSSQKSQVSNATRSAKRATRYAQHHAQPTRFSPPTSCLSSRLFSYARRKLQQKKRTLAE